MNRFYKNVRERVAARMAPYFMEKAQSEDIAYAMLHMLKTTLQHSRDLARAGAVQRATVNKLPGSKNHSRSLDILRRMNVPLDVSEAVRELNTHAADSYLLALPFTVSAMSLVAHLLSDARRRFCIVDTRFTRYYFFPFMKAAETSDRIQLLSQTAMLRHNRARIEQSTNEAKSPVTYVTFPDLQTTSLDTARRIPFMGEDYHFSTLEPLLFFRGLAPLITFEASDFATTRKIRLVSYPFAGTRAVNEADIDALLTWLAGRMEQIFREVPTDVLSWTEMRMLAYGMKAMNAVMKLKMIEGYLRAWKVADPNFKDDVFARATAELQHAQETIDKQRLAAIAS